MQETGIRNDAYGADKFGLKNLKQRALESGSAAALSILADRRRGGAVGRRRACAPTPATSPAAARRTSSRFATPPPRSMWWDGNQSITSEQFETLLCRLPQACRRQDAVRAGSLWRRRSELPDQDPRLHRTRLALAVHPHAADPARDRGARGLRARTDHRRPAELQRRSETSRLRSETVVAIDFARKIVLIGGSYYAGEMKKIGLHHAELLPARQGRDADALLGQCRPQRRQRDLLRPVRHRQDHAVGRSRTAR